MHTGPAYAWSRSSPHSLVRPKLLMPLLASMASYSSPFPDALRDSLESALGGVYEIQVGASQFTAALVETVVFTAYTVLIVLAAYFLLRNGANSLPRLVMCLTCLTMYAMATTHWALMIHYLSAVNQAATSIQQQTVGCLEYILEGEPCGPETALWVPNITKGPTSCSLTGLLMANIILSDLIVLWRAWVIWSKDRMVQFASGILLASTLVVSALSTRTTCTQASYGSVGFEDDDNDYGFMAFVLSWATNMWATGLITYRAWKHRRLINSELHGVSKGSRTERILLLFIDSGLFYCALWTVLVATISVDRFGSGNDIVENTPKWRFAHAVSTWVLDSTLIHIIGIYPTILITVVALAKSHWGLALPDVHASSPSPSPSSGASSLQQQPRAPRPRRRRDTPILIQVETHTETSALHMVTVPEHHATNHSVLVIRGHEDVELVRKGKEEESKEEEGQLPKQRMPTGDV